MNNCATNLAKILGRKLLASVNAHPGLAYCLND